MFSPSPAGGPGSVGQVFSPGGHTPNTPDPGNPNSNSNSNPALLLYLRRSPGPSPAQRTPPHFPGMSPYQVSEFKSNRDSSIYQRILSSICLFLRSSAAILTTRLHSVHRFSLQQRLHFRPTMHRLPCLLPRPASRRQCTAQRLRRRDLRHLLNRVQCLQTVVGRMFMLWE